MAGYTSASTIGGYGNVNASNHGQYNAQGYDTSPYAYSTAPSMSLGQAAWINSTATGYRSPYAGMSNLDYMQAVKQRADMFWSQAATKGIAATTYGAGYLALNAGNAFMSLGLTVGGGKELSAAAGAVRWGGSSGASRTIGQRLYKFGHAGEHGAVAQTLWHNGMTPLFKSMANTAAGVGEWAGAGVGEGMKSLATKAGWSGGAEHIGSAGKAVGGWLDSAAKMMAGEGKDVTSGFGKGLQSAGAYFKSKGVIAGITKGALRGTAALAAPLAYFMGTSALLNAGISGAQNIFTAGDDATQSAALTFESLKGKIFNKGGRDASVRNAEDIAQAIKQQVVGEQGISGAASRFLFGHKLNGEIEKKTALFGSFADYGLVDKSSSGGEFVKKAQELEKAVKSLAKTFQATTSQTLDAIRVMKSQGIGNSQLASAGANTQLTADMSGYSRQQVMSIQSRGSEAFRGTYFGTEVGVSVANDMMRRTSVMEERDSGYAKTAFAMRGKDSINVAMTKMQSSLINSSDAKKMFVASLYEKQDGRYVYTGKVNQEALRKEMSGTRTYLSDFNTRTELVNSYKTQLTSSERAGADMSIQNYTQGLNASQTGKLANAALTTAGYDTALAGYTAQYMNQGYTPQAAATLARAHTRDISNDVVSATYKADALRSLNLKARGKGKSTSIFTNVGDSLDLGIVSSLLSFTGGVSEKIFGKSGALSAEAGIAIGAGMALSGNVFGGAMFAAGGASLGHRMNTGNGWSGATTFAASAASMGLYSMSAGGAVAAAGVAGVGAIGSMGGYIGSGAARAIGRRYTGMTDRQMLQNHRGAYAAMDIGGGTLGGAGGLLAVGALLGTPIGWAALGTAAVAGAAVGTYNYVTASNENDLLGQREDVLGAARSVRDMSLLEGTDIGNKLKADYRSRASNKYKELTPIKQFSNRYNTKFNREMSKLNASADPNVHTLLDENGLAIQGMSAGSRKIVQDSVYNVGIDTGPGTNMNPFMGFQNDPTGLRSLNAGLPMMEALKKSKKVESVFERESMQILSQVYQRGNSKVKADISKRLGKWAIPYLEGGIGGGKITLGGLKKELKTLNDGTVIDVSLGQTTAMAGALNKLGSLMNDDAGLFERIRGNANDGTLSDIADDFGLDSSFLYSYVNENYKKGTTAKTIQDAAMGYGRIGMNMSTATMKEAAGKAAGKAFSGETARTVKDALGQVIQQGGLTTDNQRGLLNAVGQGGGQFGDAIRNMVEISGGLHAQALKMKVPLSAKAAKEMINKNGYAGKLNMDMFNIAAGDDGILDQQELINYSQDYALNTVRQASANELALSPAEQSKEMSTNIKRSADYLEVLVRNSDDNAKNDAHITGAIGAGEVVAGINAPPPPPGNQQVDKRVKK